MSGFTRVTYAGEFFELSMSTPSISFMLDPNGESPEQSYHAQAHQRFTTLFARHAAFIDAQMASFRDTLAGRLRFEPLSPEASRVKLFDVGVDVELALSTPPSAEMKEELRALLRDRFVLRASLETEHYALSLEESALGDDDPEHAKARLEREVENARAPLDRVVTALRADPQQAPSLVPYSAAAPFRMEVRVSEPRGGVLWLCVASEPSANECAATSQRVLKLATAPLPAPKRRSWLARLFSR